MKLKIDYKNLAAEFVVVVIGVAVALAADNWRENLSDNKIELEYLDRIKSELEVGQNQFQFVIDRYDEAFNSTNALIGYIEGTEASIDNSDLVVHFAKATRTGGPTPGANINHAAVYQELISTGRLSLIDDPDARLALSNYYREVEQFAEDLGAIPLDLWTRFRELTGKESGQILFSGPMISPEETQRIVDELNSDNTKLVRELRFLSSRLGLYLGAAEGQLAANLALVDLLNSKLE